MMFLGGFFSVVNVGEGGRLVGESVVWKRKRDRYIKQTSLERNIFQPWILAAATKDKDYI